MDNRSGAKRLCSEGDALVRRGDILGAESAYRKSIETGPEATVAWHNLSWTPIQLERYQEAEQACRRAMELEPENAEEWRSLEQRLRVLRRSD